MYYWYLSFNEIVLKPFLSFLVYLIHLFFKAKLFRSVLISFEHFRASNLNAQFIEFVLNLLPALISLLFFSLLLEVNYLLRLL